MSSPASCRWPAVALGLALTLTGIGMVRSATRAQEPGRTLTFSIAARKYTFAPAVMEVQQDDLVTIRLTTSDIPHSFTIDKYRIAKRVEPGKPVVFEFRADQPGRFAVYCSLALDERCKEMHGELHVKA